MPAPFGPMIEISSPWATAERDALDGAHAAECFDTPRDGELRVSRRGVSAVQARRTRRRLHFLTFRSRICAPLMAGMMQTQAE